jgi:hypothetical protein
MHAVVLGDFDATPDSASMLFFHASRDGPRHAPQGPCTAPGAGRLATAACFPATYAGHDFGRQGTEDRANHASSGDVAEVVDESANHACDG